MASLQVGNMMEQWGWAFVVGALVAVAAVVAIIRLRRRRRRQVSRGYEATIGQLDTSYEVLRRGCIALDEADYDHALELATRVIDRPGPGSYRAAAGHAIAGRAAARLGKPQIAVAHLTSALELDASGEMVPSRSTLLRLLADAQLALGVIDGAVEVAQMAAGEARDDDERAAALAVEGSALLIGGATSQARSAADAAIALARSRSRRAAVERLLGRITAAQGVYDAADEHLVRSADLYATAGDGVGLSAVLGDRADVAERRGDIDAALEKWRRALGFLARHPTEHAGLGTIYSRMAGAAAEAAAGDEADRSLQAAETEFARCELPTAPMLLAWARARIATVRGDRGTAVSALADALLRAEQLGLVYWRDRIGVEGR